MFFVSVPQQAEEFNLEFEFTQLNLQKNNSSSFVLNGDLDIDLMQYHELSNEFHHSEQQNNLTLIGEYFASLSCSLENVKVFNLEHEKSTEEKIPKNNVSSKYNKRFSCRQLNELFQKVQFQIHRTELKAIRNCKSPLNFVHLINPNKHSVGIFIRTSLTEKVDKETYSFEPVQHVKFELHPGSSWNKCLGYFTLHKRGKYSFAVYGFPFVSLKNSSVRYLKPFRIECCVKSVDCIISRPIKYGSKEADRCINLCRFKNSSCQSRLHLKMSDLGNLYKELKLRFVLEPSKWITFQKSSPDSKSIDCLPQNCSLFVNKHIKLSREIVLPIRVVSGSRNEEDATLSIYIHTQFSDILLKSYTIKLHLYDPRKLTWQSGLLQAYLDGVFQSPQRFTIRLRNKSSENHIFIENIQLFFVNTDGQAIPISRDHWECSEDVIFLKSLEKTCLSLLVPTLDFKEFPNLRLAFKLSAGYESFYPCFNFNVGRF